MANMIKTQLVFDIVNTEGTYRKVEKYRRYKHELGNCKIVLFDEETSNLGNSFGDVVIGKCGIYGLGDYTKTWIIDSYHDLDVALVGVGKTLDFDLNILRYLNTVLRGKNFGDGMVKQDIVDFFNYIKKNMYQIGITSAVLEKVAKRMDEGAVMDEMASYAAYENMDYVSINGATINESARARNLYQNVCDIANLYNDEDIVRQYNIVCCCVMKAYLIKNFDKDLNEDEKINKFIIFCLRELNYYLEKEIILIASYFRSDPKTQKTFKKLYKTTKVLESIKNVAWDIYHVRFLEQLMRFDNVNKRNIILPYFATADQDVVQAMRLNPLKAYAIIDGRGIPFHNITIEDICSNTRILLEAELGKEEREEKISHTNFVEIRVQLEKEIQHRIS